MRLQAKPSGADVSNLPCLIGCLIIAVAGGSWTGAAHAEDAASASAELTQRGAYLAKAADCGACHTAPHGKPFAGGLAISSPVGTIYSTNITPSAGYGIGRHTEARFARAVRRGIRADGANLYPAMPYTSYSIFGDADVHALYEYFMHRVAAIDAPAPPTDLPFPMNLRVSMMGWNLLYLNTKPLEPDPRQSELWNRGRYLVK